jgi:hypothetical protein
VEHGHDPSHVEACVRALIVTSPCRRIIRSCQRARDAASRSSVAPRR